jgi:hypothetical protein
MNEWLKWAWMIAGLSTLAACYVLNPWLLLADLLFVAFLLFAMFRVTLEPKPGSKPYSSFTVLLSTVVFGVPGVLAILGGFVFIRDGGGFAIIGGLCALAFWALIYTAAWQSRRAASMPPPRTGRYATRSR